MLEEQRELGIPTSHQLSPEGVRKLIEDAIEDVGVVALIHSPTTRTLKDSPHALIASIRLALDDAAAGLREAFNR